jgi:Tol biopolymer transport system component
MHAHTQYLGWLQDLDGVSSGHTSCSFLTLPGNAVEVCRSPVSLTRSGAIHPGYIAPTAFSLHDKTQLSHVEWFMGLRNELAAGIRPVLGVGTFGAFSQVFTSGAITNARTIDETPSSAFCSDVALGFTYARQLYFERIAAGAAVYGIQSMLAGTHAHTVAGALDLHCSYPWMQARAYCTHISPGITYIDTTQSLPLTVGTAVGVSPPSRASLLDTARTFQWEVSAGVAKRADEALQAGISASCKIVEPLTVMAGYEQYLGQPLSLRGLGFGAGFQAGRYRAHAGWKYQSPVLGPVWSIDCNITFAKRRPTEALEYLTVAQKAFDHHRYYRAIRYARRAISLNPELWKAHSLITTSLSLLRKRTGTIIGVVYAGNNAGSLLPIVHDARYIGGIGRQAGTMKHIAQRYTHRLVLNAGHNLGTSTHPAKAALFGALYAHTTTDVVGYSSDISRFGTERYFSIPSLSQTPHVSLQEDHDRVRTHRLIDCGPVTFCVLGLPADTDATPAQHMHRIGSLLQRYASQYDVSVLITQQPWHAVERYAAMRPSIDIILCSGLSQAFDTPMQLHNTSVLSCGDSGKYVGDLSLLVNDTTPPVIYDHRLVPLYSDAAVDTALARRSETIAAKIALARNGVDTTLLFSRHSEGVFPFISDRRGARSLFLKIMHSYTEYPLTDPAHHCFSPVLAPDMHSICYIRAADSTRKAGDVIRSDPSATRRVVLCPGIRARDIRHTPDGEWLYVAGMDTAANDLDIYRVRRDALHAREVIAWNNSDEAWMSFSPVDERMLFCATGEDAYWQVYMSDRNGNTPLRISTSRAHNIMPRFNANGSRIAYLSDWTNAMGVFDLVVLHQRTRKKRFLTSQACIHEYCWLGDNTTIVYCGGDDRRLLYTLDVNTGTSRRLALPDTGGAVPDSTSPFASPASPPTSLYEELHPHVITYKGAHRIVYTRRYADGSSEIRMVAPDGSDERTIVTAQGNARMPRRFRAEIP